MEAVHWSSWYSCHSTVSLVECCCVQLLTSLVLRPVGSSVSRSEYLSWPNSVCCQSHKSPPVAACQWSISVKCGTGKGLLLVVLISFPMKAPWSWEESVCKWLLTNACLSSVWFFFWQELSLDEIKTEVFSLQGLHPFFAPFVGMQIYPNPDWYSCGVLIYCINTFCFPSDTTSLLLFGTNMVSSMGFGVSDPPSSAQGRWWGPFLAHFFKTPTSFEIPQQNHSRAAKVVVLNSLSESPG